jgi:adenosylcobyric acid synthase
VLLVGDINLGGVFAQLIGTLSITAPSESARIKGLIINKFRGDLQLLEDGVDWLSEQTGKPVLGVLPYLHGLHLEAEDAINPAQAEQQADELLKVVVPVLPRISNHTDFDPLRQHPQVDLQFVGLSDPIPPADLIILPGSKSVANDLNYLREYGWEKHLNKHLRYGGKIIGICGGFQMLGTCILDPEHVESTQEVIDGFGLFDMQTSLESEKTLANVSGYFGQNKGLIQGYEIHVGETSGAALKKHAFVINGKPEGAISQDDQILGTYLHGIFESAEGCQALLNWAGLDQAEKIDYAAMREQGIERLADAIDAALDHSFLQTLIPEISALKQKERA